MSTSGTTTFNRTRNELIKGAMRVLGVLASGETPSASEIEEGAEALNLMVKGWIVDGAHLWTQTQATLFCAAGQRYYDLPGANATKTYTETAVATAGIAIDTSLIVDSIVGISNGDFIGILLDDNTIHWTTVNGVPAGSTVVIAAGLPSGSTIGKHVYAYTTKIERPLRIYNLRRQDLSGNEIPFSDVLSRNSYLSLPNKHARATPIQGWYEPQLTTGQLYLWPVPLDATHRVTFTYERLIEDFVNIGDNADFPQEWLNALKWNLAVEIAIEYGIQPSAFVLAKALELKQSVLAWDADKGSLFISPSWQ